MNWLKDLGIKGKIALIPAVAIIGFVVFLLIIVTFILCELERISC